MYAWYVSKVIGEKTPIVAWVGLEIQIVLGVLVVVEEHEVSR